MKLYLIRHGESETNKNGLWTGWLDVPLTEQGKEDAASASKIVSSVPFDKIYSSDLSRAIDTVKPLANALNLPIHIDEELREIYDIIIS